MTRATSRAVYRQIKAEGLLSRMRFRVYRCLYRYGPCTAREVCDLMNIDSNAVTPRFAELEARQVVQSVGTKLCDVTGRDVLAWDVTGRLPVEPAAPRPSRGDRLRDIITNEIARHIHAGRHKTGMRLQRVLREAEGES